MGRRVSIFGSTGSIGQNTFDLLTRQGGDDAFDVVALTGAGNVTLLAEQAKALRAEVAVTADPSLYGALKDALEGTGIAVAAGEDALVEAAARPADWTMSAIVGAAGLAPSLVCAGALLQDTCARHGTHLLPVDSEHSAIFQCLRGEPVEAIDRILLTASGGPFRDRALSDMEDVTPKEAMAHPNWNMGARISIDSATMFNKALEYIEAKVLFDVRPQQIEVVVHPQSIIHSMVGFRDGAIMAQLGPSDMRGAIGFALNWPKRSDLPVERLDFARLARLDFEAADEARFPALRLAREVLQAGGLSGAVFNAAKEAALDAFIAGQIGFLDMASVVEDVLERLSAQASDAARVYTLENVMILDKEARRLGAQWAAKNRG